MHLGYHFFSLQTNQNPYLRSKGDTTKFILFVFRRDQLIRIVTKCEEYPRGNNFKWEKVIDIL